MGLLSTNAHLNGSHPSDYKDVSEMHSDWAVNTIVQAGRYPMDSRAHAIAVRTAQVYATLAMRDKLDELTSVLKDLRDQGKAVA